MIKRFTLNTSENYDKTPVTFSCDGVFHIKFEGDSIEIISKDPIAMIPHTKPIYTHDCGLCKFLGTYENDEGKRDLYFHDKGTFEYTLLARYGNEGYEYSSWPNSVVDQINNFFAIVAKERAILFGYIREEGKLKD